MDSIQTIDAGRSAGRAWAQQGSMARRRALSRLLEVLVGRQDDLVSAITQDTGKPALDSLSGDVLVTLEQMRYYQRHAHKILAPRRVKSNWLFFRGAKFIETFEPHGVVLIYGAANYPLQLSMVPAVTALYAGNAVVVKMSEQSPMLANLLREIILQASLPANLVQIVCDDPSTAGDYIDARPDFLCFTGSSANGARVAERAARLLIPTLLELGGKDAAIVFGDCNLERTIEGVVYGTLLNSGQVCVGIKRLYVERTIYPEFLDRLQRRISELSVNTTSDASNDLAPISSKALLQRLQVQIADALERGAHVVTASRDLSGATPIVLTGVPRDALLLQEESFGPVLCVSPFADEAEAIHSANDSKFALGGSVWTSDPQRASRVASKMYAANISVNDVIRNIANPAASFGGNLSSGYGRYHGRSGLMTFSRIKTVMHTSSRSTRERNWFPFSTKEYRLLRTLIRLRFQSLAGFLKILGIILILSTGISVRAQDRGHLYVHVNVPNAAKGELAYLIFSDARGFPKDTKLAIRHGFLPRGTPLNNIDLGELPKGRYAVSLYVDENSNRKLDSGWLGIPKEPVGVSRNPHPRMGPPRFDESAFEMGDSDVTIEINMVKPK